MKRAKKDPIHYHFCPSCGRVVICPDKRDDCFRLKNGERCVECGGTWKRAK